MTKILHIFCLFLFCVVAAFALDVSDNIAFSFSNSNNQEFGVLNATSENIRYILYDVNPGEGFNLRRDVYMRIANMVRFLNEKNNSLQWVLVLPPWGGLYHWKTEDLPQFKIPWSLFFDLDSLSKLVPVIELTTYMEVVGHSIEEVFYLQRYIEGWTDGKWEEKIDERECIDPNGFSKGEDGKWHWWFWGYGDMLSAQKFRCMSTQLQYHGMVDYIEKNWKHAKSMLILRGESLNHGRDSNWSPIYWTARRSMRFAKHLRDLGDKFRKEHLDSDDESDRTELEPDWKTMKRNHGDALGGPYVAVHLRRKDFLFSHKNEVPSLDIAAKRIEAALIENNVSKVFVATDASLEEFEELKNHLLNYTVVKFIPSTGILRKYMDGGIAIIDQWIAAHAKYFIGTDQSTFSLRIQEEREILGFKQETSYNRFCGVNEPSDCHQPAKWECKYES